MEGEEISKRYEGVVIAMPRAQSVLVLLPNLLVESSQKPQHSNLKQDPRLAVIQDEHGAADK